MSSERITNLDLVKILAAFCICLHHYQQCFSVTFDVVLLNIVLPLIGFLVELFFMISGFVTAKSFLNSGNDGIMRRYGKKVLRLYPSALITVFITGILMLVHNLMFGNGIWGNTYTVPGVITSFLMINQGWAIEFFPALNNPVWYICVLLWLYLLIEIINIVCKKIGGYKL